jgi:dipeptidyl-peptidase 4
MASLRRFPVAAALLLAAADPSALRAQAHPTIAQFLNPPSPLDLASARHADRVAWMAYERGMRNVYTAAAPDFTPMRLTHFTRDDGIDLTDVTVSDNGATIVFVRGSAPNREGWVANPNHDPNGQARMIWAVRSTGGPAWRVAEGSNPVLAPDGRTVVYLKDDQIFRARLTPGATRDSMDLGLAPFVNAWGRQTAPVWSPDGRMFAWASERENHSVIMVYQVASRTVEYMAPSVDCDADPTWSADSKHLAFLRRPGTPYGQQAQQGGGGIGNPSGAAYNPATAQPSGFFGRGRGGPFTGCATGFGRGGGRGTGRGARGGRGGGGGGAGAGGGTQGDTAHSNISAEPGLFNATFSGGYTVSLMVANVATGKAREAWHNTPGDREFAGMNNIRWEGDHVVFPLVPPRDDFERYFSVPLDDPTAAPAMLTTTDGLIEDATSVTFSPDGKTLYYCTNAQDIERRHIWAVPTAGGTPVRISTGDGVETYPQPIGSGKRLAVLYFNATQPASVALVPTTGGNPKIIFPTLPKDFPQAEHVVPQIVITRAADSTEIHNQLFLPRDLKPGEKHPAIIFVHGGPVRQMLPAYHYMQFYHWAYAVNQWLASQGYVVMSINYRGGVGYGRSFRQAPNTNARGNAEYQDVLAGAHYLQSRADVDSTRMGIWGLSYGGLLTSEALARNSDIFRAGADLAGVHLYGNSLDTTAVSFQSSAAAHVDRWTSPVFLEQGDDDRNVDFSQMIGLVDLLRAHHVYYELEVNPDEVHELLVHAKWVKVFGDMGDFLNRFVRDKASPPDSHR